MSIETVPGTELQYYLIAFDADGRERTDDPDGSMSQRAVERTGPGADHRCLFDQSRLAR